MRSFEEQRRINIGWAIVLTVTCENAELNICESVEEALETSYPVVLVDMPPVQEKESADEFLPTRPFLLTSIEEEI